MSNLWSPLLVTSKPALVLLVFVCAIGMPFPLFRSSFFAMGAPIKSSGNSATTTTTTTTNHCYDLIVVGGGSAGLTAAKFAGNTLSKSVCIIEKAKLGGDCTWTGCIPSKSLLASSAAAKAAAAAASSNNNNNNNNNFATIQQRYRRIQQEIYEADDSPEALSKFQVETLEGTATLTGPKTLRITKADGTEEVCTANEGIVLCTGATPNENRIRDIMRSDNDDDDGDFVVDYVTYETIWDLKALPKRLTVVGGGPIGCELAQAFARLGSKVTVIADKLLPREEPEVSEILRDVFENDEGIDIVSGKLQSAGKAKDGNGHIAMTTTGATVEGDCLLLSIGRTPNTRGLGLEAMGIELNENGGIAVNDKLQTSVDTIYAAGDCTGDRQFTHYAGYQGAIAARNILLPLTDPGVLSEIPATTFTSPEVASVGYTEAQARVEFGDNAVAVSSLRLEHVDRAVCEGKTKGILKVVYRKRNGKILGATMMAPSGGELISEICVAMKAGMAFDELAKVIHPYPSYAIALQTMAAEVYYAKTKKLVPLYNILKKLGL